MVRENNNGPKKGGGSCVNKEVQQARQQSNKPTNKQTDIRAGMQGWPKSCLTLTLTPNPLPLTP